MSRALNQILGAIAIIAFVGPPAEATVHLDQLSACDDLTELFDSLRSWPDDCGSPRDPVEAALLKYNGLNTQMRQCFLKNPPSGVLAGFDCVVAQYSKTRTIACFREATAAVVHDYKDRFQGVYAAKVVDYLNAAAKCSVGNGDPTVGPSNALPPYLWPALKYDFGFILPVGRGPIGLSTIVHGYGHSDPDFGSVPEPVFEFVTTWINTP